MNIPAIKSTSIPFVTTEEMRRIDDLAVNKYGVHLMQMMENAGRNLANLAQELYINNKRKCKIIALAGGGVLAATRHLHNCGYQIHILLSKSPDEFRGVPRRQLEILSQSGVSISEDFSTLDNDRSLVLDGLIGYSLDGEPRGQTAQIIKWANSLPCPKLALDVPSGIDAGNGKIFLPHIKASATLSLALPKTGFLNKKTRQECGKIYLGDISIPGHLYSNHFNLQPSFYRFPAYLIEIQFTNSDN